MTDILKRCVVNPKRSSNWLMQHAEIAPNLAPKFLKNALLDCADVVDPSFAFRLILIPKHP
jgi:hypothetical protein